MPHVVITHGVEDVERWLKGKAERAAQISKFGSHVTDHVAMDGSKTVAVTADIDDLAALQAALASPPQDLQDAMKRHGVIPPLTFHIEK